MRQQQFIVDKSGAYGDTIAVADTGHQCSVVGRKRI
jgi:hypothetical protein